MNCDEMIDLDNVHAFLLALFYRAEYDKRHPQCDPALADISQDGLVNAFDIEPFVELLFP